LDFCRRVVVVAVLRPVCASLAGIERPQAYSLTIFGWM